VQKGPQVCPLHKFHDHAPGGPKRLEAFDADDVCMAQALANFRLVAKHLDVFGVLGVVGQDSFNGAYALKAVASDLAGQPYFGHTATGDLFFKVVSVAS